MQFTIPHHSSRVFLVVTLWVAALVGCSSHVRSEPYPPFITLPSGPCLRVTVFSLPVDVSWEEIVEDCDSGVATPGNVILVDSRAEIALEGTFSDQPQVRVEWIDGRFPCWEGPIVRNKSSRGPVEHPAFIQALSAARVLAEPRSDPLACFAYSFVVVGWDDAAVYVSIEVWERFRRIKKWTNYTPSRFSFLFSTMQLLPSHLARTLHDRWVLEAIEGMREGTRIGNWEMTRNAKRELAVLATKHTIPDGVSVSTLVLAMREAGLQGTGVYCDVIRDQRVELVRDREYHLAVDGDSDPVGAFFNDEFWRGLATGIIYLAPVPVPYATTDEQRRAVMARAKVDLNTEYRLKGVAIYEALVATGRASEAKRMRAELLQRLPAENLERLLNEAAERATGVIVK